MQVVSFPEEDVPLPFRTQVVVLQDQAWPDDEPRDGSAGLAETHDPALRPAPGRPR